MKRYPTIENCVAMPKSMDTMNHVSSIFNAEKPFPWQLASSSGYSSDHNSDDLNYFLPKTHVNDMIDQAKRRTSSNKYPNESKDSNTDSLNNQKKNSLHSSSLQISELTRRFLEEPTMKMMKCLKESLKQKKAIKNETMERKNGQSVYNTIDNRNYYSPTKNNETFNIQMDYLEPSLSSCTTSLSYKSEEEDEELNEYDDNILPIPYPTTIYETDLFTSKTNNSNKSSSTNNSLKNINNNSQFAKYYNIDEILESYNSFLVTNGLSSSASTSFTSSTTQTTMSTNHNVTGESELYEQIKLDESKKNSSMNSSICINNSNYSSMDVNSTNPNSSYSSTTSSNRSYINCEKLRYNDEKSIVAKPPPIPPRIPLPPPKPFVEEFPCSCRDVHVDNVFSSYCTPQKHRYF